MGEVDNSTLVFSEPASEVFYYMDGTSGTDDATHIHFSPSAAGQGVGRVIIRPSDTITITKINNKTLKDPITVTTSGFNPAYLPDLRYGNMVIRTQNANTKIDFTIFWM